MAKKKEMNRTSGTARRLTGRSEGIATKLKYGAPLTGSASGVKSISLKDAGEVLTSGIVTLGKKGLQADPASLAMALPVGKLVKAAKALRAVGKIGQAAGLEARIGAKQFGKELPRIASLANKMSGGMPGSIVTAGKASKVTGLSARAGSEGVFPRLPKSGIPGSARTFDKYDDPLLEGAERFRGKAPATAKAAAKKIDPKAEFGKIARPAAGSRRQANAMARLARTLARQDNPFRKDLK
jgi:hypothetical protein